MAAESPVRSQLAFISCAMGDLAWRGAAWSTFASIPSQTRPYPQGAIESEPVFWAQPLPYSCLQQFPLTPERGKCPPSPSP